MYDSLEIRIGQGNWEHPEGFFEYEPGSYSKNPSGCSQFPWPILISRESYILIFPPYSFISTSGFNTPQLAVADFERLKLLVAESEKFRGEYSVACCGDSKILGNFFICQLNRA